MAEEFKLDQLVILVSKWPKPMNKTECSKYFAEMSKTTIDFMERNIEMVLEKCIDGGLLVKESEFYRRATLEDRLSCFNARRRLVPQQRDSIDEGYESLNTEDHHNTMHAYGRVSRRVARLRLKALSQLL